MNSSFGVALRVVLIGVRVEGGIVCNRELGKDEGLTDIEDLNTVAV